MIVTADSSHVTPMKEIQQIADSVAAKKTCGNWECPKVGIDDSRVSSTHTVSGYWTAELTRRACAPHGIGVAEPSLRLMSLDRGGA